MLVVRLVERRDIDALIALAAQAVPRLTNLPEWREGLEARIESTRASLEREIATPGDEVYMFSLEDTVAGRLVGTATLRAQAGIGQAYYTYRRETMIHASPGLGLRQEVDVLSFSHEISTATQLCALAVAPEYRDDIEAVALLRRARLAFIKQYPQRFAHWCAVAFAGVLDARGRSPFWESVGRHFFDRDFAEINFHAGRRAKSFVAEMMPQLPLYEELLTPEAREVIGETHIAHRQARQAMLEEGFKPGRHIDIFDAGPVLTARAQRLRTVAESRGCTLASREPGLDAPCALVARSGLKDFRVVSTPAVLDPDGGARLGASARRALEMESGERLLLVPPRSTAEAT